MLEQLLNTVEWSLKDLGRLLFPPCSREQMLEEIDRLSARLQHRCGELTRSQRKLADVKRRLRDNPTDAALLHSHIESMLRTGQSEQAWLLALELDRLRQSLAEDRRECPPLEQRCWSLHFDVRQLQRRLDRALERLTPS